MHYFTLNITKAKGEMMKLSEYFENVKGVGVLATANSSGKVNAAIYGRPHFMDEQTVAFIAADKLTHANLQSNPHAVYIFKAEGNYEGRRLYLTKLREEKDSPLIDEIRRKKYPEGESKHKTGAKFLLYFHIDNVLPLIGDGQ
jgi:cation transport ATPase